MLKYSSRNNIKKYFVYIYVCVNINFWELNTQLAKYVGYY